MIWTSNGILAFVTVGNIGNISLLFKCPMHPGARLGFFILALGKRGEGTRTTSKPMRGLRQATDWQTGDSRIKCRIRYVGLGHNNISFHLQYILNRCEYPVEGESGLGVLVKKLIQTSATTVKQTETAALKKQLRDTYSHDGCIIHLRRRMSGYFVCH